MAGGYNSFCDIFQYNIPCYVLGYGQNNLAVETNIFEIEARLQAFSQVENIHRLYDFDIKKIEEIIKYEYTKVRDEESIYKDIKINGYSEI